MIDGVFLGGRTAFVNGSFLRANHVQLVINCAPHEVRSALYTGEYFAADLDDSNNLVHQHQAIARLLEACLARGQAALIVSARGQSRCVAAFAAFLIHKFHWTTAKALTWLAWQYPGLRLTPRVVRQLQIIENQTPGLRNSWTSESEEEAVLVNTYLNGRRQTEAAASPKRPSGRRVVWVDKPAEKAAGQPPNVQKSILKGSVLWKQQSRRLHRSDSGSTLDSCKSADSEKVPGKAFFIGLAKARLLSQVRRH